MIYDGPKSLRINIILCYVSHNDTLTSYAMCKSRAYKTFHRKAEPRSTNLLQICVRFRSASISCDGVWRPHALKQGVCASNMEASHRHGGEVRHFNRVTANNNDGQQQFGVVHMYDIFTLAQVCTVSQIGRRLTCFNI